MMKITTCFECGSKDNYELREITRTYAGDGYSFDMIVKIPFCKLCGAPIYDEEIEDNINKLVNNKIREYKGIIKSEEIRAILNKYNVSQKFLSKLLGWGEITLTRYISGGYTPNAVNSTKLKDLENPYKFQKLLDNQLEETEGLLNNEPAYDKVQAKVNEEIHKLETTDGKIYQVVNWFLAQNSEENPLTHLSLQKLLYSAQCWSVTVNGRWIFQDHCEAWIHGAVYPNIYKEFKKFRYLPLPKLKNKISLSEEDERILKSIKRYYYDIYNARSLELICHLELPYIVARKGYQENESCTETISKKDIENYYGDVAKKYSITADNMSGIKNYLNDILLY